MLGSMRLGIRYVVRDIVIEHYGASRYVVIYSLHPIIFILRPAADKLAGA